MIKANRELAPELCLVLILLVSVEDVIVCLYFVVGFVVDTRIPHCMNKLLLRVWNGCTVLLCGQDEWHQVVDHWILQHDVACSWVAICLP